MTPYLGLYVALLLLNRKVNILIRRLEESINLIILSVNYLLPNIFRKNNYNNYLPFKFCKYLLYRRCRRCHNHDWFAMEDDYHYHRDHNLKWENCWSLSWVQLLFFSIWNQICEIWSLEDHPLYCTCCLISSLSGILPPFRISLGIAIVTEHH